MWCAKNFLYDTAAVLVRCDLSTVNDNGAMNVLFMLFPSQVVKTELDDMIAMEVKRHF